MTSRAGPGAALVGSADEAARGRGDAAADRAAASGDAESLAAAGPLRCRACGAPGRAEFVKRGFVIASCAACGCHFVPDPVPDPARYDEDYFAGAGECGYGGYLQDRPLILANFARRARWIAGLGAGARVLDVGAAYGFFVAAARAEGFDAIGLEPVPPCATFAARELGVEVRTGLIETADLEPASFDVVTMFDVIEHLADPAAALRRIRTLLAPGGLLVAETGDLGGLLRRVVGSGWYYYDPPQHLTYFSVASLGHLLRATGFEEPSSVGHLGREVSARNFFHQLGRALGGPLGAASQAVARSPLGALNFSVPDRGNAFIAAARRGA
ncbi:MAG: class I SAM-dependent methyltransferase [Candidatus Binatia bacterium]